MDFSIFYNELSDNSVPLTKFILETKSCWFSSLISKFVYLYLWGLYGALINLHYSLAMNHKMRDPSHYKENKLWKKEITSSTQKSSNRWTYQWFEDFWRRSSRSQLETLLGMSGRKYDKQRLLSVRERSSITLAGFPKFWTPTSNLLMWYLNKRWVAWWLTSFQFIKKCFLAAISSSRSDDVTQFVFSCVRSSPFFSFGA